MPNISVKITNLEEIKSAFRKAPARTVVEVNKAIYNSLFQIETDVKETAPHKTGYMKSHWLWQLLPLKGSITALADYAIYVHEGTYKMKARPFLLNSVKTKEKVVEENFKKAVQNVLDDIARDTR